LQFSHRSQDMRSFFTSFRKRRSESSRALSI